MSELTSDSGAQREDAGGGFQPEGGRPFGERHRWVRGGIGESLARSFLFLFGRIEARTIYWEAAVWTFRDVVCNTRVRLSLARSSCVS